MIQKLKELISTTPLTKKESLIAEFILDNFTEACFMTSTDLAAQIGVSNSSVIRFTRTLGFSGYMEFQREMRSSYTQAQRVESSIDIPAQRLKLSMEHRDNNVIKTHLANVQDNIASVLNKNAMDTFDQASDIIIGSRNKYLVASRANTGIGDMMLLWLKHMLPNVFLCSDPAINVIDHISDIDNQDCLILTSFPRYSQMDVLAAQMAYEAGAKIILFTDKATSPLARFATILFTVNVDSNTFFNSYVSVLFLAEALCANISNKIGVSNADKLTKIDKYISQLGVY